MTEKLTMTQIRKMRNIDQEAFGKPAGLSQQQISDRENKKVAWKMDEVNAIRKAFGIPTEVLALEP